MLPDKSHYDNTVIRVFIVCFVIALVCASCVAKAEAAPARQPVTIQNVRASEGFYTVQLGSGRVLIAVPLLREAPPLHDGDAQLDGRVLWQGGWGYKARGGGK